MPVIGLEHLQYKHFHLLYVFSKVYIFTLYLTWSLRRSSIQSKMIECALLAFLNDPYSVIRIGIRVDPALVDLFNDFFYVIAKQAYSTEGLFTAHFSSHTRTAPLGSHMRTNRLIYACF